AACGAGGQICQQCANGEMCQLQKCVPVVSSRVGDACFTDLDCAGIAPGAFCKQFTSTFNARYQGGYCTLRCNGTTCPMGSSCATAAAFGESDVICLANCTTTTQCRMPGYACYAFGPNGPNACWIFPTPPLFDGGMPPPMPDAGVAQPVGA